MEMEVALAAFAALSQETRLQVLKHLVRVGPGGTAAGDLATAVGVPGPTLSFHLKELAAAGLVRARRDGRSIFYSADYEGLRALIGFLMADCCAGDPRIVGDFTINKETCDEPSACALPR
ncbi:MAG: helix-turn-helix transcriptional regulator [Parvularculaceae bacterium]|jgi:DNA-binding transcriptional ArsR family regulator|nr:helix-turn-helix transcriptional regulator [Parvularculaceae bacterium]